MLSLGHAKQLDPGISEGASNQNLTPNMLTDTADTAAYMPQPAVSQWAADKIDEARTWRLEAENAALGAPVDGRRINAAERYNAKLLKKIARGVGGLLLIEGPPCVGKGTLTEGLEGAGYRFISSGAIVRRLDSPEYKKYTEAGELVPDEIIYGLVKEEMGDTPPEWLGFDGFPRTKGQLDLLRTEHQIALVISLRALKEVTIQRGLGRNRSDDNEATMAKRYENWEQKTLPLVDYIDELGIPRVTFDGNQHVDDVLADVLDFLAGWAEKRQAAAQLKTMTSEATANINPPSLEVEVPVELAPPRHRRLSNGWLNHRFPRLYNWLENSLVR